MRVEHARNFNMKRREEKIVFCVRNAIYVRKGGLEHIMSEGGGINLQGFQIMGPQGVTRLILLFEGYLRWEDMQWAIVRGAQR